MLLETSPRSRSQWHDEGPARLRLRLQLRLWAAPRLLCTITRWAHGLDASSDQRVTARRTEATLSEFRQGPAQSCMEKRFMLMAKLREQSLNLELFGIAP